MSSGRFRISNDEVCANDIWCEFLAPAKQRVNVLTRRGFEFHRSSIVATASGEAPRPTDWFIFYAVAQVLVRPELCGANVQLNEWTQEDVQEEVARAAKAHAKETLTGLRSALKVNPLAIQDPKDRLVWTRERQAIRMGLTEVVNRWRANHRGGERPIALFGRQGIGGSRAITSLRAALVEGLLLDVVPYTELDLSLDRMGWLEAPDNFGGARFKFARVEAGDPRDAKLETFGLAAFGPKPRAQIINGFAKDIRGGLTAFATELFDRRHRDTSQCRLPMLYLPLHGRGATQPLDTFSALAFEIWAFYHQIHVSMTGASAGSSDLGKPLTPPGSLDQTIAVIDATRRLMGEYPAIILFDGYRGERIDPDHRDYALFNLTAAIAGDRLFDLIERLTMIPTPGTGGSIDVERFRNNRLILLSEHALYVEGEEVDGTAPPAHPHPALRLIPGRSISIPSPRHELVPDILGSFGNQHPDQMAWIRREILEEEIVDEEELQRNYESHTSALLDLAQRGWFKQIAVSESVVGVLSAIEMLGAKVPTSFKAGTVDAALRRLISDVLWPALLRDCPQFTVLLHLIAIAPGGLRPKTLARVYEHYSQAFWDPEPGRASRESINDWIGALLIKCHGLLNVLRSDRQEGVSGRPVPVLFRGGFGFGKNEIPCDRAIEFVFADVRDIILEQPGVRTRGDDGALSGAPSLAYLPFLHLLLAEEAYEQATHLARYDNLQGEESLHRKSRLLTAIYHGVASLGDDRLATAPIFPASCQFLPDNPRDRWLKIYAFVYRRNLDRAPDHDLIRHFDAAQTKFDILLALARPQLCRSRETPPADWLLPRLTEGAAEAPISQRRSVMREFALDLRRASHAVSRQLQVNWEGSAVRKERANEQLTRLAEAALTLTGSPSERAEALSAEVMIEIQRHLGIEDREKNPVRALLGFVESQVEGVLYGATSTNLIPPHQEYALFEGAAIPRKKLKPLIDYLSLLGEIEGIRAERDFGDELTAGSTTPSIDVLAGFAESFSAYYMADFLRERTFWQFPRQERDAIGGRAARGFVRVSLKLERFRVTLARERGLDVSPGGWFWQHAHRVSDEYARHLSRFPRERAGNLILDATMARYYESRRSEHYPYFLEMARECLRTAEPLVLKLSMHNRLRQRFALERTKVLGESARLAGEAGRYGEAENLLAICDSDIESFERIAGPEDQLWKNLAKWNRDRLAKRRRAIENLRSADIPKSD